MKRIRVAILGQGRSGRDIHGIHLIQDKRRYRIVACVDPLEDRRQRAANEYGCEVYADHRPLLGRPDIDLIVNATPSHLHVPISLDILRAGHHCLCEKPLASRVRDVDRLIAASKKARKRLAIFQQSLYAPYFTKLRQVIASGVLGRIVQATAAFNGYARRWDWQTLQEFSGGNLLNTGPHPLGQALRLLGADRTPQVTCFMDRANTCGDAEDHVDLTLRAKGRPLVRVEVSSCNAYPTVIHNVQGTRGGLTATANEVKWRYFLPREAPKQRLTRKPLCQADGTPAYCGEKLNWHEKSWDVPPSQRDSFAIMSALYYRGLHRSLTEGTPLGVTPQEVRQQIAVIEECQAQNPDIYKRR